MEEESLKSKKILYGAGALVVVAVFFVYGFFFSAPESAAEVDDFIVPIGYDQSEIVAKLKKENFIKNMSAFGLLAPTDIEPGGYYLSRDMSAFRIAQMLKQAPVMKWVTIKEGLRKEEIAALIGEILGWDEATELTWLREDTAPDVDHVEGVYFPDTYLIPLDETPAEVATRLRRRFDEKFAPYAAEALKQNIRWPTVLKIASLVQREAGGKSDMPLIAGILWNRLLDGMKLDVDATVQYARDTQIFRSVVQQNIGDTIPRTVDWWAPLKVADKKIDSPYNTYTNSGLPPAPIANPGVDAISAVLNPTKTSCFYYLHDREGVIHCARTYEEHLANIKRYL